MRSAAPRKGDRSISTFDIKHNFAATYVYDLPFGRGRRLLPDAPAVVNALVGGWTTSGVLRLQGGQPFIPFITDTNKLGGTNRTVRPTGPPHSCVKRTSASGGNVRRRSSFKRANTSGLRSCCEPMLEP